MTLTQKEKNLIQELKGQEQLCKEKYTRAAGNAVDGQLKGLFQNLADKEQKHFDSLSQLENGTVPTFQANAAEALPTFTPVYSAKCSPDRDNDCFLCTDLLTAEKHASSLYDTCVFEFRDDNARALLNHIQKEEQDHGQMISNYLNANGMYN